MRPPLLENIDTRDLSEETQKVLEEKPRGILLSEAVQLMWELKTSGYLPRVEERFPDTLIPIICASVKRLFRICLLLRKVEQTLHQSEGDFGGQVTASQ